MLWTCLSSSFFSCLSILQSFVGPCFGRNSGKPAGFPLLSSPSCSEIGGHWVGKLKIPKQWSFCFFSVFCSHTGLDSKSSSHGDGNINFNIPDSSYTWGPALETLKLWCCGCRDTELLALFGYVKKSWHTKSVLFDVWELAFDPHKGTSLMSWLFGAEESCFVPKKLWCHFCFLLAGWAPVKTKQSFPKLWEKKKRPSFILTKGLQWERLNHSGLILLVGSSKALSKENAKEICMAFSNTKMLYC